MRTQEAHEKYGPVVRIAPRHLSYTDRRAWNDIYGHRIGAVRAHGHEVEIRKAPWQHGNHFGMDARTNLISTPSAEVHADLRRALASGFADRALRDQQGLIRKYVDLLVLRLRQNGTAEDGARRALDMVRWYSFCTFDVIADLVFAEGFGMLKNQELHPWAAMFL